MNTTTELKQSPKRIARIFAAMIAFLLLATTLSLVPNPAVAAEENRTEYSDPNNPQLKYTVPNSIEPGEDIVISGTGWQNATGDAGSVVTVMLDAQVSGDPNTVRTKRQLSNPISGELLFDNRFHAVVHADANGDWEAVIPFPTAENSSAGDEAFLPRSTPEWLVGSNHSIRLLTGTMLAGDVTRSLTAQFVVAEKTVLAPPSWDHLTVTHESGAVAWIQKDIETGAEASLKIRGRGWSNSDAATGSTVAIKLNYGSGQQYTRSGTGIVQHPSASGDDTIWALLAPSNSSANSNVFPISEDGEFEVELDLPDTLTAGQQLSILFQSGRFVNGDQVRSVTSENLVVGGVPFVPETETEQAKCVPSVPSPTISFPNPVAELGGTITVTGQGWCHPGANRGGSVVALKIDEGAYEHLDSSIHANRTIWATVEADEHTGDWSIEMPLPDGTTATSLPAFIEGSHTIRALTGSLKDGDQGRTMRSDEFVVGPYRPNGPAEPVEASEALNSSSQGALRASISNGRLLVNVPKAERGEWVYLNVYDGNTPLFPFGESWLRADLSTQLSFAFDASKYAGKTLRVTAQSGNQDSKNELLGWATIQIPKAPVKPKPAPAAKPAPKAAVVAPAVSVVATGSVAPTVAPKAPATRSSALTALANGGAKQELTGTISKVTVPLAEASEWVYLFTYTGAQQAEVGWVQLDADKSFEIDLAALGSGKHRVAVVAADDTLLGWSEVEIADPAPDDPSTTTADSDPVTVEFEQRPYEESEVVSADNAAQNPLELWLLIGAGVVLLAGAIALVAIVVRGKKKA